MSTSEIIAAASAIIALGAVALSYFAGRKASKAADEANELTKRQVDMQERLTRIEQSREHARLMQSLKAEITARLEKTDGGGHRLVVTNSGKGTARNLNVLLDGKPVMEHPAVSSQAVRHVNREEIRTVGPGSPVRYLLALHRNLVPPFECEITWDDDSGEKDWFKTTLTF